MPIERIKLNVPWEVGSYMLLEHLILCRAWGVDVPVQNADVVTTILRASVSTEYIYREGLTTHTTQYSKRDTYM